MFLAGRKLTNVVRSFVLSPRRSALPISMPNTFTSLMVSPFLRIGPARWGMPGSLRSATAADTGLEPEAYRGQAVHPEPVAAARRGAAERPDRCRASD